MRFKAKISSAVGLTTYGGQPTNVGEPFIFSKKKIYFSKKHNGEMYYLSIALACGFKNESVYDLQIIEDREGKNRKAVMIGKDAACISFIKMNAWNRFKCNLIHKRYLFQRDPDWFWKTAITAGIGFIFSLIGIVVGYNLKDRNVSKEGQSQGQEPPKKLPFKALPQDSLPKK